MGNDQSVKITQQSASQPIKNDLNNALFRVHDQDFTHFMCKGLDDLFDFLLKENVIRITDKHKIVIENYASSDYEIEIFSDGVLTDYQYDFELFGDPKYLERAGNMTHDYILEESYSGSDLDSCDFDWHKNGGRTNISRRTNISH